MVNLVQLTFCTIHGHFGTLVYSAELTQGEKTDKKMKKRRTALRLMWESTLLNTSQATVGGALWKVSASLIPLQSFLTGIPGYLEWVHLRNPALPHFHVQFPLLPTNAKVGNNNFELKHNISNSKKLLFFAITFSVEKGTL